jgi:predicted small secreted protein
MNVTKKVQTLILAAVGGLGLFTLSACNTTEGIGEDIEAAGDAIDDAADDANDG